MIRIQREHIPEPIREALAIRELLHKLGFKDEEFEVYFEFGGSRAVTIQVKAQDMEYSFDTGFLDWCSRDGFKEMWDLAVKLWDDKASGMVMSGTTQCRICEESKCRNEFLQGMREMGFRLYMTVHPKGALLGGS